MALSPPKREVSTKSSSKLKQRKDMEFKRTSTRSKNSPKEVKYFKTEKEEIDDVKNPAKSPVKKLKKSIAPSACREAKSSALNRAHEVRGNLPEKFPSFVKSMLPSHVTGGFWLGLPKGFCTSHLPKQDETVVLVDEGDEEHKTKYLAEKTGLSGGWRSFSIAHNLLVGDVLVFQLIRRCRFKVYIVRVNSLSEIDGAISLLNLDIKAKPIYSAQSNIEIKEDVQNFEIAGQKSMIPCTNDGHQVDTGEIGMNTLNSDTLQALDQSGNESDDFGPEVLDGIRFSQSSVQFKDVKGFQSFCILVDGLVIDSEIPKHNRIKYYELCCSRNSYLHDHLTKGLNSKLAAGIISETVNIADAIRAAKLTTSCDYLQTWDKTLKAFEDMGMEVEFLRSRLNKLVCLSHEQQEVIESKKLERARVGEEMRDLQAKLLNVKEVIKALDAEIEALKVKNTRLELTFNDTATTPW